MLSNDRTVMVRREMKKTIMCRRVWEIRNTLDTPEYRFYFSKYILYVHDNFSGTYYINTGPYKS